MTYQEFIDNILNTRGRFACGDEYHERHHIVPRCMGGTNDEDNLIDLFAREHFEVHRLLALENPENDSLVYAWWMMAHTNNANQRDYEITAEEYEEARIKFSYFHSVTMSGKFAGDKNYFYDIHLCGDKHPMYGRKHTLESREKMSQALKGKMSGENNPRYGTQVTQETRQKISEANKGRFAGENNPRYGIKITEEIKEKIRSKATGRYHTDDVKRKMSESRKGKNNANAKIVCQFNSNMELIAIWEYEDKLAQTLSVSHSAISAACMGIRKTAAGFVCKFLYDQTRKDGTVIQGAISLGLIAEEEALKQIESNKTK